MNECRVVRFVVFKDKSGTYKPTLSSNRPQVALLELEHLLLDSSPISHRNPDVHSGDVKSNEWPCRHEVRIETLAEAHAPMEPSFFCVFFRNRVARHRSHH